MKQLERILHYLALIFVVLSVVSALFVPAGQSFIFDDLFFPFGALFMALTFFQKKEWRWIIILFCGIALWGAISDFMANTAFRTAHLGMLLRWLKWPVILIAIAELGKRQFSSKTVLNAVITAFLLLSFVNIVMMLNPFGVGEYLHQLYSPKPEVILGNYYEYGAFRLSGTMLNPNNNAAIFGLFLLFFLSLDAKKYWKYILLAFVLIFLTQSRTTLLVVLAVILIHFLRFNSRKVNLILIPSGILALIIGLFVFRSTNLLSVLNGSAFQSDSWTERMAHYSILFDNGFNRLILGNGIILDPFKQVGFYFDSEYLSILYQYGIVGMLGLFGALFCIVSLLYRGRNQFFGGYLLLLVLGLSITNFTFLNVEFATLMCTLAGAMLFFQSQNKLRSNP